MRPETTFLSRYPLICPVCKYVTWSWNGWTFACYNKTDKDCEGNPRDKFRSVEAHRHPLVRAKCSCGQMATHFDTAQNPVCETCNPM